MNSKYYVYDTGNGLGLEQPQDCIFGYGVCCYPIEECISCPSREREVKQ